MGSAPLPSPSGTSSCIVSQAEERPGESSQCGVTETSAQSLFHFLNLSKNNITLWEEEPKLYIIMYSSPSLPFVMSATHWAQLGELEPIYKIRTTTASHQCVTWPAVRLSRTWGVPNDYLNPNTSSMKMIS